MATFEATTEPRRTIYVTTPRILLRVILIGAIVGAVTWVLALLLERYVIDPIFCRGAMSGTVCAETTDVAGNIALVVTAFAGMFAMVRASIFRPMLIALAAAASLWGIMGWLSGTAWYVGLIWSMLLYALTYVMFAWFARINNFVVALAVTLVIVILARIIPA